LRKLEYYQEGKSDKHLTDIKNIMDVSGNILDMKKLKQLIEDYGFTDEWKAVVEK
jgi:hypothetical protein